MNIIVTGASRGIGFETVRILAGDADNHILAIARNERNLARLVQQCRKDKSPGKIHILPFDLAQDNIYKTLVPAILDILGSVDILVNIAGLMINKPFVQMDDSDFDAIFDTNVKGVVKLIKFLHPHFSGNSHILNIGSMGGYQGSVKFPGLSLYSASKGALAILTECLAEEFKDQKISVNCLALGSAQTEMLAEAFPGYKAPLTAAEMAAFIAHFAVKGHLYFNGKILPVSLSTP